ncbi:MAG: hypothetical protein JSR82_18990 [Verrucomicrobia bacterium]|nr:hypothetical protein [Verrucomicrobiota bacterium]
MLRLLRCLFPALLALGPIAAHAADAARVTQTYADVRLQAPGAAPRPAVTGDTLPSGSVLRTAAKSRTELKFADGTLVRAGALTQLQAGAGTRELLMAEGTAFLHAPFRLLGQGSRIRAAGIVAVGNGSAFLIEHTPTRTQKVNGQAKTARGFVKVIALKGELRVALYGRVGESTLLEPGQMMILDPNAPYLPATVDVDLTRLVATTQLLDPAKWSGVGTDLTAAIREQAALKKGGTLIETNLSIFGRGTDVTIKPPTVAPTPAPTAPQVVPPAATPAPTLAAPSASSPSSDGRKTKASPRLGADKGNRR